jgi:exopolyphosphatase/pppGpp-phosphohydrolase
MLSLLPKTFVLKFSFKRLSNKNKSLNISNLFTNHALINYSKSQITTSTSGSPSPTVKRFVCALLGIVSLSAANIAECKESKTTGDFRVAIDIGAGNTKLSLAVVDPKTNKILELLNTKTVAIPIGESVMNDKNREIPEHIIEAIIEAINQFKSGISKDNFKCLGTATEGMRSAKNGLQVLEKIAKKTDVSLFFLTQDQEALQGHQTLKAEGALEKIKDSSYILWENGNGSCQISTKDEKGQLLTFNHPIGKIAAKTYLKHVQSSPDNPITKKQAEEVILQIKNRLDTPPSWLLTKLSSNDVKVFGCQAMFSSVTKELDKRKFTKEEVLHLIDSHIESQKIHEKPTFLSDLLFIYAIMDTLNIQKIHVPKLQGPGSTSGLLTDPQKWL